MVLKIIFLKRSQNLRKVTYAGSEESQGTFDIAKLWVQCSQGVKVPRAPTREVMSIRAYTVNREMNRLRRAACKLWQSRAVATIIERMELEIEKLRLVIRKDKQAGYSFRIQHIIFQHHIWIFDFFLRLNIGESFYYPKNWF